jgi:hypothetical protein
MMVLAMEPDAVLFAEEDPEQTNHGTNYKRRPFERQAADVGDA